jgi:N6-L-threonylcarbamoyladenine synthase
MLCDGKDRREISAVGASDRPRDVEGSYMPCFLAGASQGRVIASLLHVPFFAFSHQQGHLAAAAWSADRMDLLDGPFLAWHLSGGTTELLLAEPNGAAPACTRIGGSTDLAAGQLIDRTGQALGLQFPAGPALERLAEESEKQLYFPVKRARYSFSLSGIENQVRRLIDRGERHADIARFVQNTLIYAIAAVTEAARKEFSGLPVLCSGGVSANRSIRTAMEERFKAIFAQPEYAGDNALGAAILAMRKLGETR